MKYRSKKSVDLDPVSEDIDADLRAGDAVVPVHEGVDDGLAQGFEGYLVNVVPVEAPDLAADIQMPFKEQDGLIKLRQQIVAHVQTVVDMNPVRALEGDERQLRLADMFLGS